MCSSDLSPGLGSNYINRQDAKRNKYREYKGEHDKTDETCRFRDGSLAALPKYYKEKLYTEEEREELWIQKQEEGYKFIMGEKHKVENEEDEKKWEKDTGKEGLVKKLEKSSASFSLEK